MPSPKQSSLPDLTSYDWKTFELTKKKNGEDVPISEGRLRHILIDMLRVMHATTTFEIETFFKVRNERERLTAVFAEKLGHAIRSAKLDPGFDYGFLLKHHEELAKQWLAPINAAMTPERWPTWQWQKDHIHECYRSELEWDIKKYFTKKGKPFEFDYLLGYLCQFDTYAAKDLVSVPIPLAKESFSASRYKKSLPPIQKEKLERESELLGNAIEKLISKHQKLEERDFSDTDSDSESELSSVGDTDSE